jgi:NAD(P)H-flavin reductase
VFNAWPQYTKEALKAVTTATDKRYLIEYYSPMIRPQPFTAKLSDKIILNDKFQHLYFELEQPNVMEFEAGQYISLALPGTSERRSYSLCSAPEKNHGFELMIDISPHGKGVQYLESLQFGQEISFLAPLGIFVVPPELSSLPNQPLTFIASGSGIAPFRGMLLDQLQQKNNKNTITLYWGIRHEEELFWLDEFEDLMVTHSQFKFHPVISQAKPEWPLCRGRVTDCLSVHQLPENADYFLCGSSQMILDMVQLLDQKGIPKQKVHREKFF